MPCMRASFRLYGSRMLLAPCVSALGDPTEEKYVTDQISPLPLPPPRQLTRFGRRSVKVMWQWPVAHTVPELVCRHPLSDPPPPP